jgi:hypothetical protein
VKRFAGAPEREAIGGRAVEDEKRLASRLEDILEKPFRPPGPGIIAITGGMLLIGFSEGSKDFRADPGVIVARKMAGWCRRLHRPEYRSATLARQLFSRFCHARSVTRRMKAAPERSVCRATGRPVAA